MECALVQGRIAAMDENRFTGSTRSPGGKTEEETSRLAGEAKSHGTPDPAAERSQDIYDHTADTARQTAAGFEKWLRSTIETQPYTAALAALGIGWLLGRMHRPL